MIYRFVLRAGIAFEIDHPSSGTPQTITMRRATVLQITQPVGVPDVNLQVDTLRTFDRVRLIGSPVTKAVYYEQEGP